MNYGVCFTLANISAMLTSTKAIIAYIIIILAALFVLMLMLIARESDKKNVEYKMIGNLQSTNVVSATPPESEEDEEDGKRFCMLSAIEEKKDTYGHANYDRDITLESFCNDFRDYAASRLKLYYDISDIRRFIAGMAVSHILILQGMSGTGKTSLAHAFGSYIDNASTIIPVQPMWKERTDLIGYYNEFTKKFNETLLLEKMYEANYSEDMYVTVLDEMNIARIE